MIKTYSPSLKKNLDPVIDRIRMGLASCIILEGGLGQGKTTLGIHIADYVNEVFGAGPVDIKSKEQIATGGDEFRLKLVDCYKKGFHALVYDESGDFSGRGYVSKYNKELYRIFQIYRAFKVLVILVLPSFTDLDSGLFKLDVVRFLLKLKDRDQKRGVFLGYSLKKLIYAKHNIRKGRVVPAFCLRNISPNFYGIFKNLDPVRARQLNLISTDAKIKISRDINEKNDSSFDIDEDKYGSEVGW